jgi:uncharacterized membrane protein YeaQ/YmgE (transglycosylase-associated protein family)
MMLMGCNSNGRPVSGAASAGEPNMLVTLDLSSWLVIITIILFLSFWIGFVADAVLEKVGLGLFGNMIVITAGAFTGIFILDYCLQHYILSQRFSNPYMWFLSAVAAGTLALIGTTFFKSATR